MRLSDRRCRFGQRHHRLCRHGCRNRGRGGRRHFSSGRSRTCRWRRFGLLFRGRRQGQADLRRRCSRVAIACCRFKFLARFALATIAVTAAAAAAAARFVAFRLIFAVRTLGRLPFGQAGRCHRLINHRCRRRRQRHFGNDERDIHVRLGFRRHPVGARLARWTWRALGPFPWRRLRRVAHFAHFAPFARRPRRTCWTGSLVEAFDGFGGFFLGRGAGRAWFALFALTPAWLAATAATARPAPVTFGDSCRLGGEHRYRCHHRCFCFRPEEVDDLVDEAGRRRRCRHHGLDGGLALDDRCRLGRRNGLDHRFLARLDFLFLALAVRHVGVGAFGQVVAGLDFFQTRIVVLDAFELVVRRFQVLVRDQDHGDAVPVLDLEHLAALFVEQESTHIDRHLDVNGGRIFLHRLFLDDAQNLQGGRFGVADVAGAGAARAGDVAAFGQGRTQALTRQFHQAEAGNLAHLDPRAVKMQRVFQAGFDFALILCHFHVDEIDDDQAAQVAQTQLARHFFGRFTIGVEGGRFDIGAAGSARRVDVDRDQSFRMVDHDRAAGRQRHGARVSRFDLMFNLKTREQGHVVAVALHAVHHVGHHMTHELVCLFKYLVGVDQDLADIGLEVVTDGANHER